MANPCLLVKKSVLNCRTTELKVLCRSLGRAAPLSSFSRTPLSTGPSQMRSTSWTSSVSNTRKWSLNREKRKVVILGSALSSQGLQVRGGRKPKRLARRKRAASSGTFSHGFQPACPSYWGFLTAGTGVGGGCRFCALC